MCSSDLRERKDAPFHFYFGLKTGLTALDKFKQKYLSDE